MFDTVGAPGFITVGPAFAGIAAAPRTIEPSKVRTAVRIVVVLQRFFVMAPGGFPGADEHRLYALCIGVMSRTGLIGISGIEQVSCVSLA
jgi:hypothetical protein